MGGPLTKKPVELVSLNHLNIPVPKGFREVEKTNGDTIKNLLFYDELYLQVQNKKTGNIPEPIQVTKKLAMSEHPLTGDSVEIGKKPYTILRRLQLNMAGGKRRIHKTRRQRSRSRVSRRYTRRA